MSDSLPRMTRQIKSLLGHIQISISDDNLKAYLSMWPNKASGQAFSSSEILTLLDFAKAQDPLCSPCLKFGGRSNFRKGGWDDR